MIGASVAMVAMAGLFVVFGFFALGDTERGCDGGCGTCATGCERDREGEAG